MRRAWLDPLVALLLAAVAIVLFATVRFPPDLHGERSPGASEPAGPPPSHVQDFAYVFNYARWAAARPGASPYALAAHREFLSAWLGPRVGSALCFAYGPMMVLVLAPLFLLTTRWAWLAWNLAGAGAAASAIERLSADDDRGRGWGRVAVVGATAFHCLVNGQTALVGAGCMAAVFDADGNRAPDSRRRTIAVAAWTTVLSAKPPLALVAIAALLAAGRVAAATLAALGSILVVLLAVSWWGPAILHDYATLVARYNLVDADELVRAGFAPQQMSNLRGLLLSAGALDDAQAFRLSACVLLAALAIPIATALRRGRSWPLELGASWAVLAYLLFAPHLTLTEDVLLVIPLLLLRRTGLVTGSRMAWLVVGCVAPQWVNDTTLRLVSAGHPPSWSAAVPAVAFALKLVPAAIVVELAMDAVRSRSPVVSPRRA